MKVEKNKIGLAVILCLLSLSLFTTAILSAQAARPPKPPKIPSISVEKYVWYGGGWVEADTSPGPSILNVTGPTVQFNVTVTNTGTVGLSKVVLTDTADPSSPITSIGKFAAGASYNTTYTLPWSAGNHSYPVSVIGVYHGKKYTDSDDTYYVGTSPTPSINVVKTANLGLAQVGETVTYTFTVTNTGNVPLSTVSVTDNVTGAASRQSGDTNTNSILETTETWIFTDTWTVETDPNPVENTATATAYYGTTQVTDTDLYSLNVSELGPTPLTLSSPLLSSGGDRSVCEHFGYTVAIGSGIIAISSPDDEIDWDVQPYEPGYVYVYNATTQELITTLISPHAEELGEFGNTLAVSGNYLFVGAPSEDADGPFDCDYGAAYVYSLDDLSAPLLELVSPTPTMWGWFGAALATDGTNVFVGAPYEDVDAFDSAGAVHIFALSDGSYVGTLNQTTPEHSADYGTQIVVDDTKLYISAPGAGGVSGWDEGEVYVYDVETRSLLTTLYSPMPRYMGTFGESLTVGSGYIIVGAASEDDWQSGTGLSRQGLVHIFNATTYELVAMIKSPNPTVNGFFGTAVATDGTYLVISAPWEGTIYHSGKAYVYTLADVSTTPIILTSPNSEVNGGFGDWGTVAISDGTVVIGAPYEAESGWQSAGHAYIFSLSP
jgi:uncharacterized repeat protein (TIGR01451 family)